MWLPFAQWNARVAVGVFKVPTTWPKRLMPEAALESPPSNVPKLRTLPVGNMTPWMARYGQIATPHFRAPLEGAVLPAIADEFIK
jgi:hypothetical protein